MKAPTGPAPTARDIEEIKDLIKRAGSAHTLQRWIKLAGPQGRRGRPANSSPFVDADDMALLVAEMLHLGKSISLHKAIKLVASWGPLSWKRGRGASESAMVKRLLAKARAERVAFKKEIETLTEAELQRRFKGMVDWADSHADDLQNRLIIRILAKAFFDVTVHSD